MPYKAGKRLPSERASKLGHLDVIKSELVNKLIQQFDDPEPAPSGTQASWEAIKIAAKPLRLIFAVDGSLQTIRSDFPPYKELSFVKTALLRLDQREIEKLDPESPHPLALRDIMADAAMYHATVFPLKGLRVAGTNNYDAVRRIVYESLRDDSLNSEPYKTLKWLAYELWSDDQKSSPSFACPHCDNEINGLAHNTDEAQCPTCKGHVYLSDMIGFHLDMGEDSAPVSVSTAYMLIHETLLLFTGIRYFWERGKYDVLSNALFLKDGPLTLRSQYSKLVPCIRSLFEHAKAKHIKLNVAGQEKTGAFVDHLDTIAREAPVGATFIPSVEYIRREIQHRPERAEPYGSRTNYGNKVLIKMDDYHHLVLSVPTGDYKSDATAKDLIGYDEILATLPNIISYRHECALVPIELANGVASLSNYPSAAILKIFAGI